MDTGILEAIIGTIDSLLPSKGKCIYSFTSSSGKKDTNESVCVVNAIQLYHFSFYVLALYHILGCLLLLLY